MSDLGAYLARGGAQRRVPGTWDCCTFPADWAVLCGRPDPMAAWRGTYDTEEEAERLIAAAGGLAELFAEGMAAAGIAEVTDDSGPLLAFEPGDMAVVALAGHEAGAIYTGKRWAFVLDRGLGFVSLDRECIVRAWRA